MLNYKFGLIGKTGFPELLFRFDGSNFSYNFPYVYNNGVGTLTVTPNSVYNSSAQYKFGGSSAYFDGGINSYITLTSNSANVFNLSNGDFTIEFWVRPSTQTTSYPSIFSTASWPTYNALSIRFGCSTHATPNAISVRVGSVYPSDTNILISDSLSLGEWHHVAYTRTGSTHRLFIDGEVSDTYTELTNNWPNLSANGNIFFGNSWDGYNSRFKGYLDDFHIIRGLSLYTSNFELPELPVGAISKIDIGFDSDTYTYGNYDYSNNSTYFTNIGSPNMNVYASGTILSSTDISKSSGRSCFIGNIFDNNQSLSIESAYNIYGLAKARIPFVFEFWFYNIFNDPNNSRLICWQDPDTRIYLYANNDGIEISIMDVSFNTFNPISQNEWHHLLIHGDENQNITCFVDGINIGTQSHSFQFYQDLADNSPIIFGSKDSNTLGFCGYIDNIKFTYNSNNNYGSSSFTPPNNDDGSKLSLLLHFNENDLLDGNAGLLLHFDNNFDDDSTNNFTVIASGNAVISSTESAFGGYSLSLDGIDSFVSVPHGSWAQFGTGDFTLEAWVYINSIGNQQIFGRHINGIAAEYIMAIDEYGNLSFYEHTNQWSGQFRSSDLPVPTGQWNHVAVTRENGTLRLFVNGQIGTTHYIPGSLNYTDGFSNEPITIGGPINANGWMFNGYIDEIRLIKGLAAYTQSFPIPTGAPTVSVNSKITDYGMNNISVSGNIALSSGEYKFGSSSLSLNGIDQFVSFSGTSDFNFHDKDFTIEAWVYPDSSVASGASIISTRNSNIYCPWEIQCLDTIGTPTHVNIGVLAQSGLSAWYSGGILQSTVSMVTDSWNHMVLGLESGNLSMIINGSGSILATGIIIEDVIPSSIYVGIGGDNIYFSGYIDELRIINNYCPYNVLESSNYIPILPFQSKPLLHMHFDVLPLINSVTDNSTTITGDPGTLNPTGLFGSCLNSSNTITLSDNRLYGGCNNTQLSSILTDLTLEFWIFITDIDHMSTNYDIIWTDNFSITINNGYLTINYKTEPYFWITLTPITATYPINAGSWYHIAFTKSNNRFVLYQNGSKVIDSTVNPTIESPIINNTIYLKSAFGYMDELRLIQGALLYTNNFNPPNTVFDGV